MYMKRLSHLSLFAGVMAFLQLAALPAAADLYLGPEELVQADGADIQVSGWSVPSFVYWDGDDLKDLVVGEGGNPGKVRVYLNAGTSSAPQFTAYFYAQSGGADLEVPGAG